MRLTLRTLLSYLDQTLDEPARGELERQIAASEHASEWVHRTRDVMRRLKLEAPSIEGTGATDDPNTVAEYLDRTLPEESVAEFERVCLESDKMLAEVASCHHVLAMFLTEPPDVDQDTRARLHRLKDDLAAALRSQTTPTREHSQQPQPVPAAAAPEQAAAPVPEYLRPEPEDPVRRWAPAAAALLLLAVTIAFALGRGGGSRDRDEVAAAGGGAVAEPVVEQPASGDEPNSDAQDANQLDESAESDAPEPEATGETGDETAAGAPDSSAPETPPNEGKEPTDGTTAVVDPGPEATQPIVDSATDGMETEAAGSEAAADEEDVPPPPIQYLGPASELAVHGVGLDAWRRVTPEQAFGESTRIVSLPTFRSTWLIDEGASLEVVGLTDVGMTPRGGGATPPRIELAYGRLVLKASPDGAAESTRRVDLVIDGVTYEVGLGPGAVLAIEADRFFTAGELSAEIAPPLVAIAHGLAGEIGWKSQGVELRTSKPKRWFVTGDDLSGSPKGFGEQDWVASLPVSPPDKYAAPELAQRVPYEAPIWPALAALADPERERFREVRSLAGRSSLALGHPEPLVESFRIADEQDDWRTNLDALRTAAARSVEAAAGIQRVMIEKYGGAAAEDLAELMIGFDAVEVGLEAQAVSRGVVPTVVVPLLESEDLASRVLAGLVLDEVIEPLDRPFDPLEAPRKRTRFVQALKRSLQNAEVNPAPQ